MQRPLPIKAGLSKIRLSIDAKITKGDFDKHGHRNELHQLNSLIFSDLRACLLRKASTQKALGGRQGETFTIKQLEEVAKAEGESLQGILRKAYVDGAIEASKR